MAALVVVEVPVVGGDADGVGPGGGTGGLLKALIWWCRRTELYCRMSNGTYAGGGPVPGARYFSGGGGGRFWWLELLGGAGGGGNGVTGGRTLDSIPWTPGSTGEAGTTNTGGGGGGGGAVGDSVSPELLVLLVAQAVPA